MKLLYGQEVKEVKQKKRQARRRGEAPLLSQKDKQIIVGFGRFLHQTGKAGVASVRARQERQAERRLQKARTIKSIRESNLPREVQDREIKKLSGVASQTSAKSAFFKFRRTPRELRQSAEANF